MERENDVTANSLEDFNMIEDIVFKVSDNTELDLTQMFVQVCYYEVVSKKQIKWLIYLGRKYKVLSKQEIENLNVILDEIPDGGRLVRPEIDTGKTNSNGYRAD